MKELLEDIKLSKVSYLVEKLEKRDFNEKLRTFRKLEKMNITKKIGLYLIENSTREFEVVDDFGGINSSLIELCFKNYYEEYNDAIREIFKDLPVKAQDRVLNLLTTRFTKDTLDLYVDLVLQYYKERENIPIGDLINKPLAYPYLFPKLYKALKFDIPKNNIIILLSQYLTSGVVLKDDIKQNKKIITNSICKLFEEGLKYKFKDTYFGLHNKEYKDLRYFLELAVNIEFYISGKKTKEYLNKLLKKNDNQLKLFILDNYIRKNQKLTKFDFEPIINDKASRYALFELLSVYEKLDLLKKKKTSQKDLALSDLYTNFVITTSYTNEPKNIKYIKKYTKDNYDYYVFKFDYKYKYSNTTSDYLTNYICNQLGIDKYNGEDVTNKFIGLSGGYNINNKETSKVEKKHDKLLISKIQKNDNIDEIIENILKEHEIKNITDEKETTKKEAKKLKKILKRQKNDINKTKKSLDELESNLEDKKDEKKERKHLLKLQKKEAKQLKKQLKKQKKQLKYVKEDIDNFNINNEFKEKKNYHIFDYILLFFFAVFIGLLIYCMLYIYGVGSINDGVTEKIIPSVKLKDKGNFTEIMGTEIFNQTENEYFVLFFKESKKEKTKYYKYINEYSKRKYRFYFVDLKNKENRFLYGPNDLGFTLYTDRFLKVKEKEFEYYVDGKKNILNEMELQINEMIEKEKEEEKQAQNIEKGNKFKSIVISMTDNKKDKKPVSKILVKAARKQEEINQYDLKISNNINFKPVEIKYNTKDIKTNNNKALVIKKKTTKKEQLDNNNNLITYELKYKNNLEFNTINKKTTNKVKSTILTKSNNKKDKLIVYKLIENYKMKNQIKNITNKVIKNNNQKKSMVIYKLEASKKLTLK